MRKTLFYLEIHIWTTHIQRKAKILTTEKIETNATRIFLCWSHFLKLLECYCGKQGKKKRTALK